MVGHPALRDLDRLGLGGPLGGGLTVEDNDQLNSLDGLLGISAVAGDLVVRRNPALPTAAISAVVTAVGVLNISGAVLVSDNGP